MGDLRDSRIFRISFVISMFSLIFFIAVKIYVYFPIVSAIFLFITIPFGFLAMRYIYKQSNSNDNP